MVNSYFGLCFFLKGSLTVTAKIEIFLKSLCFSVTLIYLILDTLYYIYKEKVMVILLKYNLFLSRKTFL